jgi:hypothetical protein
VVTQFTSPQTAGDLNVIAISWYDTTSNIISVTDSAGNAYRAATAVTRKAGLGSIAIYYVANILSSASNSITVKFSNSVLWPDVRILEYRGLALVNPVDVSSGAAGNSSMSSSGSVTTTNAHDLLFAANYVDAETTTGPGAGFSQRILTTPDDMDIAEDETVTAVGSYSAAAILSFNGNWVMQMVAFKAAD